MAMEKTNLQSLVKTLVFIIFISLLLSFIITDFLEHRERNNICEYNNSKSYNVFDSNVEPGYIKCCVEQYVEHRRVFNCMIVSEEVFEE